MFIGFLIGLGIFTLVIALCFMADLKWPVPVMQMDQAESLAEIGDKKSKLFNRALDTVIDNRIKQAGKFSKKKPHSKNTGKSERVETKPDEGYMVVGDLLELGTERSIKRPFIMRPEHNFIGKMWNWSKYFS